ncbi:MAG TPA: cytochrome c oxidase accessory protein CcoG [Oscillatoriaceae cyanobacterium]
MSTLARPTAHVPALLTGRPRVQPRWIWGKHERRRWTVFAIKFGIFLGLPWITVGGAPALLFDVPDRQYHLFGQVFWPQDFYLLGLFFAIAAFLLFFTTALIGRLWCGFACPQTLLTSLFMLLDDWIEGDRASRLAMDHAPFKPAHLARRALKHAVWLLVAGFFGFTFTSYFVGAHELLQRAWTHTLALPYVGLWVFISGITYLFAGHLRDWVCTTVCPYGRFQGAMQDVDSLLVTYDRVHGEPRGKSKEIVLRGGCVDCGQCVAVCPMGIDIRQGYQYECISCMRCIDACDATMTRLHQPVDLIRLASQQERDTHEQQPEAPLTPLAQHHWWRPRLTWYAAVLAALVGALVVLLVNRPLLAVEVDRDRNAVFALPHGQASNLYALTLVNKDTKPHRVQLALDGLDGRLVMGTNPLTLAPGAITHVDASVLAPRPGDRPVPVRFTLRDEAGALRGTARATFFAPGSTR